MKASSTHYRLGLLAGGCFALLLACGAGTAAPDAEVERDVAAVDVVDVVALDEHMLEHDVAVLDAVALDSSADDVLPSTDEGTSDVLVALDAPSDTGPSVDVAMADAERPAPLPDFTLVDRNPASPTYERGVSPRMHQGVVSGWYFALAS